jgi:hypothetical protein
MHVAISSAVGGRLPADGAAFQDVGDENGIAAEAHRPDDFREKLAGLADERLALRVLVSARRLADEHQLGVHVAHAKDDLRAAGDEVRAFFADENAGAQRVEAGALFLQRKRDARRGVRRGLRGVRTGGRMVGCLRCLGRCVFRNESRRREPRERSRRCAQVAASAIAQVGERVVQLVEGGFES